MAARPFRQFVVKVHSRCDLACDHCYVYRHADQSWRRQPRVMAPRIARATAERISEHAAAHRLRRVTVVLHGGEPLLAGPERLSSMARELRRSLDGVAVLDLRMQTNGLLLDEAFCAVLARERIRTGVSLDGDRASHDRHRVRADGSGSYDDVVRAIRLLGRPAHRAAFAGLLCTVDVSNDPDAVYEALAELRPPRVDFLLPHATWDHPPPRPHGDADYADWLITVYDRWNADDRPFSIRMFESVEAAASGEAGFTEALGLGSPDLVVIETDGSIEQADWLKTVGEGAPATGFHVLSDTFDEASAHTGFQARTLGLDGLSEQCRRCPVVEICGGGLYGHRHRSGSGFANPSVYCPDLLRLIRHVRAAPAPPRDTLEPADFTALTAGGERERTAVLRLAEAQLNLRRAMLAYLHQGGAGSAGAWQALLGMDGPALDAVLSDPAVHAWAVAACAAIARGLDVPDTALLDGVALATAVHARRSLELPVRVGPSGVVTLPTVGRLLLPDPASRPPAGTVPVVADDGGVRRADGGTAVWEPVRRLAVGGITLRLAHADDHRPTGAGGDRRPATWRTETGGTGTGRTDAGRTVAGRAGTIPTDAGGTGTGRTEAWQRSLEAAWGILSPRQPHLAAALAAGVSTVVAVDGEPAEDAPRPPFGALALPLSAPPEDLALALAREWQYAKFAALRDLYDLGGAGRDALRRAYVRLAVARAWRARPGDADRERAAHWQRGAIAALGSFADEAGDPAAAGRRLAADIGAAARALDEGA
ncbi:FxsB family cyclophane-forming radical SAM/SPASM peptide maturase [Streptomyces sp. NPDC052015]|uniref:FxsB family cyclophane-forming radical SAM/SPASM peptide maturase n=1 Tax=Streptomyces sp. NPDC052015 TaxID=3154755 RepID=UPI0034127111